MLQLPLDTAQGSGTSVASLTAIFMQVISQRDTKITVRHTLRYGQATSAAARMPITLTESE